MRYLSLIEVLELQRMVLAMASGEMKRKAFVAWLQQHAIHG
ncbi:hypothetical protein XM38_001340 [Halomicronema hongdechloris C2206]|uniref:Uncharacterized protein n=1 Tax=Halomicronema hongdechloris C2206 TaxID=1641165 RepID=A0A1Z3HFY6_9CYAN|nr:hypothetical protein XM38_001340 [Halomicronema hongdechloris C2206]